MVEQTIYEQVTLPAEHGQGDDAQKLERTGAEDEQQHADGEEDQGEDR